MYRIFAHGEFAELIGRKWGFLSYCIAAAVLMALAAVPTASGQTTWYVDDDALNDPGPGDPTVSDPLEDGSADHPFDAIQEGIDAAVDGDTVLVADGTYTGVGNKDLDYAGKAITVRSENGPETCIIDCEHDGRGFSFNDGETSAAVVDGFTITGGIAGNGGAVSCTNGSSPTIQNCTIVRNHADYGGGGVNCGIDTAPTIANCIIIGNTSIRGGGIRCIESTATVVNCTISGGSALYGAGVFCDDSSPTIANCTISENSAHDAGGGVGCSSASSPKLINCTINGNSADRGGGAWFFNSSPMLTNCTISGNSADYRGGALYCDDSSATLTNCILWGDTPQEIRAYSGDLVATYCDIQGGWPGEGNIDADSLLAFADDCHLMPGSPCIDAGTNDPAGGLPAEDPDGNTRPLDGDGDTVAIADMGAFEFNPALSSIALSPARFEFFAPEGGSAPVDQTLSLRNCGSGTLNWGISGQPAWLTVTPSSGESAGEVDQAALSVDIDGLVHGAYTAVLEVADAQAINSPREVSVALYVTHTLNVPGEYPTIQAAIDAAAYGDVVEIADGTYTGAGNKNLDFGGKAITVRGASGDPAVCVIDCEADGRGFYFHSAERPDSVVEGLTITNGSADDGGAVYCTSISSPTLIDCTISANSASADGGGVVCYTHSNPTLIDCTISGNEAEYGGGVYCYGFSNPTLADCTISGNLARDDGGAVYCRDFSNPTLADCTISGNLARDDGGGVYCYEDSSLALTDCTIDGNSADRGGGAYCSDSTLMLTNCTINGNSSALDGGGVFLDASSADITDCTISGNSAQYYGGGVWCLRCYGIVPTITLTNCTISGNSANVWGGGIGCLFSIPTLTNCTISGNQAADGAGVYCYDDSDATFTDCTINGNSADRGGGAYCDGSSLTLTNCTIDGNSANHWGSGVYCCGYSSPTLVNCTFSGNSAVYGGGGFCCLNGNPTLTNCVLWGDAPEEIIDFCATAVTYCNVQGGWAGEGNIDADPLFVDPNNGDLHVLSGSPCIDAANNAAVPLDVADLDGDGYTDERTPFDLDGKPRFVQDPFTDDTGVPDPPRYWHIVDMGAYEYQFCFGDLDEDDDVDLADLTQLLCHYDETTGMTYFDGDLDGDGDVDLADLAELLGVYGDVCE